MRDRLGQVQKLLVAGFELSGAGVFGFQRLLIHGGETNDGASIDQRQADPQRHADPDNRQHRDRAGVLKLLEAIVRQPRLSHRHLLQTEHHQADKRRQRRKQEQRRKGSPPERAAEFFSGGPGHD